MSTAHQADYCGHDIIIIIIYVTFILSFSFISFSIKVIKNAYPLDQPSMQKILFKINANKNINYQIMLSQGLCFQFVVFRSSMLFPTSC